MRITISRSGGFAGIRPPPVILDTTTLPDDERKRVENLVTASNFFSLPETLTNPKTADQFLHHVTIASDDGREHSVAFHADVASAALRDLFHVVRDGA